MSEELIPTNRQEKIMSDTIRALNGDDVTDALVPGWDDEYFLDNILKAAQGEDPLYNLEPRWHHQKFYKAIAEAIAESGGGGGESLPRKDVNFVDYDGTVVASYTAAEFAALTELPKNPTHDGLTGQGWNMTLVEAKAQVAASGKCDIGQMYVSADGKTRLYIRIEDIARNKPKLYWSQTAANGVEIDWGDGSEPYTASGTGPKSTTHTYSVAGDYVITLDAKAGKLSFPTYILGNGNSDRVYSNCLKKAVLGGVTSIGSNAFGYCYSLASITIPSSVTSIEATAFGYCYSLASVTIPSSVTSIGSQAFYNCSSLASVAIPSSVTSIDSQAFYNCSSLASVTIPSSVTSIGNNAFGYCYSLASITIPSSVTSIGNNAFNSCSGVTEYHIKATTPPTAGTTIFKNISSDCKIYVPSASVNTYKAASGWSTYASQIYGE